MSYQHLISTDDLPPILQQIADLIGLGPTLRLVEDWGGVKVYVPMSKNLADEHWLTLCVGREAAELLCDGLGSGDLILPKAVAALRAARDRAILTELERGASTREVALKYRLGERRVWEIKAINGPGGRGPGVLDGQFSLF